MNYIVAYACKGNESEVQEKQNLKLLILEAKDEENNVNDLIHLARKVLNDSLKAKVVSRQEAIFQLAGISLYNFLEFIDTVSISGNVKIGTERMSKYTFL